MRTRPSEPIRRIRRPGVFDDGMVPALSLDFLSGVLDSRITFTRSTAGTFYKNGLVTTAGIDVPRFQSNPVTGASEGLLIEGASTNLVLQSQDLSTSWVNQSSTDSTDVIASPDGTVNADSFTDIAASAVHGMYQTRTGQSSSATYTVSAFIKKGSVRYLALGSWTSATAFWGVSIDMDTPNSAGLVTAAGGSGYSVAGATITDVGGGWYRVAVSGVTPVTAHSVTIAHRTSQWSSSALFQSYAGDTGNFTYVWGLQYEQQAFASSYIPTVASTVLRDVDSAVMSGSAFSSWFNPSEGSILCFHAGRPTSATGRGLELNDGTADERHALSSGGGNAEYACTDNAGSQAAISFSVADSAAKRYAAAYRTNDFAASVNGAAVLSDGTGTLPSVDRLWIGASSATTNFAQTTISRIAYWPTRLSDSVLTILTA